MVFSKHSDEYHLSFTVRFPTFSYSGSNQFSVKTDRDRDNPQPKNKKNNILGAFVGRIRKYLCFVGKQAELIPDDVFRIFLRLKLNVNKRNGNVFELFESNLRALTNISGFLKAIISPFAHNVEFRCISLRMRSLGRSGFKCWISLEAELTINFEAYRILCVWRLDWICSGHIPHYIQIKSDLLSLTESSLIRNHIQETVNNAEKSQTNRNAWVHSWR